MTAGGDQRQLGLREGCCGFYRWTVFVGMAGRAGVSLDLTVNNMLDDPLPLAVVESVSQLL